MLASFAAKSSLLTAALVDKVKNDKLSGGVLNARSGALRDSIVGDVALGADSVSASVGSTGDVKYAAIQEYGGKTAAHEILPDKARALAFFVGGALRFARRVEHPGSTIPERSYLRSSLDEMSPEIVASLGQSVDDAWGAA
jgi:phage gpG-like protein